MRIYIQKLEMYLFTSPVIVSLALVPQCRCQGHNFKSLQWRHNERDGVSNHQPHDCLFNRLFWHEWKKTSKLRVTGLCVGNSPVTNEFPAQRTSNAENASIWWRHHVLSEIDSNHLWTACKIAFINYSFLNKRSVNWYKTSLPRTACSEQHQHYKTPLQ